MRTFRDKNTHLRTRKWAQTWAQLTTHFQLGSEVGRRKAPSPVTWQELFHSWDPARLTGGIPMPSEVAFTDIRMRPPLDTLRIGEGIIDWWPTALVATRRAALARDGISGVWWNSPKGTLHTAELLHACDGAPEAQAAVLIAASLWDKRHNLPETWRGDIFRLLEQMQRVIVYAPDGPFKQHDLSVWHHAMRDALPINSMGSDVAGCVRPRDYRDLVSIALLDAALATTAWTLVIVSHDERGLRKV